MDGYGTQQEKNGQGQCAPKCFYIHEGVVSILLTIIMLDIGLSLV